MQRAFIMSDDVVELDFVGTGVCDAGWANACACRSARRWPKSSARSIYSTLDLCEGNKRRCAEMLGVSLKTLYNRLAEYQSGAGRDGHLVATVLTPAQPRARRQTMIRILIADDHAIVRAGLKQFIADQPDMQIAGEAATGKRNDRAGARIASSTSCCSTSRCRTRTASTR